ncbi:MAG: amidase family protein [Candidatus Gracilibacteria bacterium]|nr:amidase family protein [Candidatus Gracilibacteria bacterium]
MTSIQDKDIISDEVFTKTNLKGKVIGVPKEYFEEGLEENVRIEIKNAINKMKELGAEIKEISLPMTKYGVTTYYILMPAEVSTKLLLTE